MVANAILIRSNTPRGPWTQLLARPQTLVMFAHTEERIQLFCTDDGYHPVDEPAAGFAVAVTQHGNDTVSAAWNRGKLGVGGDAGQATVTIHPQGATEPAAMIDLSVIKACDSLTLRPSVLALRPEASGSFDIRGRHGAVAGIAVPAGALSWTLPGDAVSMTRPGRFKGRKPGTRTVITARLGQAEARADVAVTERVRLDELDTREGWSVNRYPPQGSHHVEAAIMTETHPRERRFVRLTFDLGEPERTRAVYLRLDRDLGHALSLEFDARSRGGSPWIRVALRDARNRRHTMTAKSRLDPAEGWQTCNLNLPETWAWPVTLESIYVVETAGKTCQGQLDLDTITVERIPATPTVPGQP